MAQAVACGYSTDFPRPPSTTSSFTASSSSSSFASSISSFYRSSKRLHYSYLCRLQARRSCSYLDLRAVSAPEECNEEECAPEMEVGKLSMEWKAEETSKVLGTFPPLNRRKWTGYVEKDTAGQTNIYSVEPTVYVSESAISSNTAGDSTEGSAKTILVSVGLALGLLFAAGLVLQRVGTSPSAPNVLGGGYNGPSLSYYIQKFKPAVGEASTYPPVVTTEAFAPGLTSIPTTKGDTYDAESKTMGWSAPMPIQPSLTD